VNVQRALVRRMEDQDWAVRAQLAASLGALPLDVRVPAAAVLLERHGDDPIVVDASISGLSGHETEVIEKLLAAPGPTPMLQSAIAMLAGTVIRGAQDAPVMSVFALVGEAARPAWQRSALLQGAEVALLGVPPPGTPERRTNPSAAAAPCPTCPGARSGPGGAPAFPKAPAGATPPAAATAGRGGRGSGGPVLRLNAEPAPLVAVASTADELGARAARVLEHVQWPGKAGAPAPPPVLTPEERQWFAAGEEIYKNLCQACHQPDGRGLERVGANLVGSPWVTGAPEVAARIVLHGKEGTIGLMPPLGAALSDDQIAGALTFIRRQWGNTASAISPALVKSVRSQTTDRNRPWTNGDLAAIK